MEDRISLELLEAHVDLQTAAAMLEIYRPFVESSAVTFETETPDAQAFRQRIALQSPTMPWLTASVGDEIVGYAYASGHRARAAYRFSVETSVYVAANARRRGVGRALYRALLALVQAQGFCNAYGGITLPNEASVALHESFGFEPVGVYRAVGFKLGRWCDVGWWQLRLAGEGEPAEPRRIDAIDVRRDDALLNGHVDATR